MVQVPGPTKVATLPATVQTLLVRETKLTGRPELAEAMMTNGEVPRVLPLSGGNVIVWEPAPPPEPAGLTTKDWLTDGAAAKLAFPACEAAMVQVPEFTRVTVFPVTVHTLRVRELKLTGRPELAVALIANGEVPSVLVLRVTKVMVWELVPPPDPAGLTAKDWPTDGAAV